MFRRDENESHSFFPSTSILSASNKRPATEANFDKGRTNLKLHLRVLLAGAMALATTSMATAADIVDTAIAGKFNTLVAAVKAAGLVDTLKGPGPFTVFAPTDGSVCQTPGGYHR